jgi:hypothetical protein
LVEGKTGAKLYSALDNIQKAGLLNICAKMHHTTFQNKRTAFSYVNSLNRVRGHRFFAGINNDEQGVEHIFQVIVFVFKGATNPYIHEILLEFQKSIPDISYSRECGWFCVDCDCCSLGMAFALPGHEFCGVGRGFFVRCGSRILRCN